MRIIGRIVDAVASCGHIAEIGPAVTQLMQDIASEDPDAEVPAIYTGVSASTGLELTVPWNTLTSYVREQVEGDHPPLDLEILGATAGQVVKIKKRK